jgi:ubiquinone/menaquinone biosynthesis C-methylase UbiE
MRAFYDAELPNRSGPPPGSERLLQRQEFIDACRAEGRRSVLEVGCGAGHDGMALNAAGLRYGGSDLSAVGAALCGGRGLPAVQASATRLPFPDHSFDAAWTMSTLMHLPGDDIEVALAELGRVVRPAGLIEIGVWGADDSSTRIDELGRYFRHRTDAELRELLSGVGEVTAFRTWDRLPSSSHYQWARVRAGGPS